MAKDFVLRRFDKVYEPSGVVQLQNGEIAVIEDEPNTPVWRFQPYLDKGKIALLPRGRIILSTRYDDLEGITGSPAGEVYLLTSHSTSADGSSDPTRQQLIKLDMMHHDLQRESTVTLTHALQQMLGEDYDHVNIEGLTYLDGSNSLLLGLRSPLDGKKSIVLELRNPHSLFANGSKAKIKRYGLLSIGGGIRALCHDSLGKRLLIANEIRDDNGKNVAALWSWEKHGDTLRRLKLPGAGRIKNIEGIAIISWRQTRYILLVCDDGSKKSGRGGHYLIFEYGQI